MFQNLPTKDNVPMVMRNTCALNPYLSLNVIKVYTSNANAYKRRELTHKEDLKN